MSDSPSAATAKSELRASIRAARRERLLQNDDAHSDVGTRIADRVMELPEVRAALEQGWPIACYASRPEEPPTTDLRDRLLRAGAMLLLPQIAGDDLRWVEVTSETTWSTNRWGIEEPVGAPARQRPRVWIVPALAIDSDGFRLGQGGGFYDRALAQDFDRTCVIGIVFDDEVIERVPREEHDTTVEVVITPEDTRRLTPPELS